MENGENGENISLFYRFIQLAGAGEMVRVNDTDTVYDSLSTFLVVHCLRCLFTLLTTQQTTDKFLIFFSLVVRASCGFFPSSAIAWLSLVRTLIFPTGMNNWKSARLTSSSYAERDKCCDTRKLIS